MSQAVSQRVQRVQRELFALLSSFLVQDFAEVLPAYAAISAVEVSPDLKKARVFFRLIGEASAVRATENLLERDRSLFQRHVARSLDLKFTPVLRFSFGTSQGRDEIDELFANLHRPRFGGPF